MVLLRRPRDYVGHRGYGLGSKTCGKGAMFEPGTDTIRRPGGECQRRSSILRLSGQVDFLGKYQTSGIEPTGDEGQPGGGAGDQAIDAWERVQREHLAVHH